MKRETTDKPLYIGTATVMVNEFEAGYNMDQIALRHGFTSAFIEQLIRLVMIARRKGKR